MLPRLKEGSKSSYEAQCSTARLVPCFPCQLGGCMTALHFHGMVRDEWCESVILVSTGLGSRHASH